MCLPSFMTYGIILSVLIIVWNQRRAFKYHIKFISYNIIVSLCCLSVLPYSFLRPCDARNSWLATFVIRQICVLYGIKWRIKGLQNVPNHTAVIVCNHQSSIDFLGMCELWPIVDKCAAVAKRVLMYCGPFGLIAWLNGTVFIDRGNSAAAREALNKSMEEVKRNDVKLWIFPEGTRSCSKTLLPFKKGAFHLAIDYQVPILPIVFSSYSNFLDHKRKIFNSGDVDVTILPPISTEGLHKGDLPALLDKTRNQMQQVLSNS